MKKIKDLSILLILVLVTIGFVVTSCAKKEETQEELRREIEPYLKELEKSLKSTEPLIRGVQAPKISRKLQKIAEKNKPQIIPILIEIIKDKKLYWEVRYDIASILGSIESSKVIEVVPDLIEMLKNLKDDEDEVFRYNALQYEIAEILGESSEMVPHLIKMLKDEDEVIWQCGIRSLCFSSKDNAIETLIMTLKDEKYKSYTLYTMYMIRFLCHREIDEKRWEVWGRKNTFKKVLENISLNDSDAYNRKFAKEILEKIEEIEKK